MIAMDAIVDAVSVTIPAVTVITKEAWFEKVVMARNKFSIEADVYVCAQRNDKVTSVRLEHGEFSVVVCLVREYRSSGALHEIHAPGAVIIGRELILGDDAEWMSHPALIEVEGISYARAVIRSWRDSLRFRKEAVNDVGEVTERGFRLPQLGALHAIAAHWSVKTSHAKVVLPTGTGKTDGMIAASLMKPANRTLLLVPSDALRSQVSSRFSNLGILRLIDAVPDSVLNPVVGRVTKTPSSLCDLSILHSANVVVSTTQMLLGASDDDLREFLSLFDLALFDEAHHLPSASWTRISKLFGSDTRILSVTATPYRNDRRRVPGEMIYQFPLRMAQQLGYFTSMSVVKVDERDPDSADTAIAVAAVDALRRDEVQRGFRHLIMARARTREHVEALFSLYSSRYSELEPVLLHYRIGAADRKRAIEGITALRHRVIVCVDMLGEGIDIPSLKIAALHDSHKSLPVTLQFIGRFTRSSTSTGGATVVVNIADPMVDSAVAELFAEDADWNEIVPELSAKAVGGEEASAAFIAMMQSLVNPEEKKFDLSLISAKANVTFYTAQRFDVGRVESALPKTSRLHQSWLSEDRTLMVMITQDLKYPGWSSSRDAMSFDWNLTIIAFNEDSHLISMNTTYGASRSSNIARAVGGSDSALISGERMFRVFDGLHRSVLYNVGLYRRGQLRFQMLAGKDIGEHVSTAIQAGSTKSNLFAIGYEEGSKVNIGASFKGRVWSMGSLSIEEWKSWCFGVARKIRDESIATDSFLRFTLIPREITVTPDTPVFACILPDELLVDLNDSGRRISVDGCSEAYNQLDLSFGRVMRSDSEIRVEVFLGQDHVSEVGLQWGSSFCVLHRSGARFFISSDGDVVPLEEFLTAHPPALLLRDGSEVLGKYHFKYPEHLPYTFSPESILSLDWTGVPITIESKWRNGELRSTSVQGHMISLLIGQANTIVFDDDDTGEAADIIVITENQEGLEVELALYHCKYASGREPGARVKDLYEVCGQAVKSSRLLQRPEMLLNHMIRRERRLGGRRTRFEKGAMSDLYSILRKLSKYRIKMSICVVQPGLAASALTPELSSILASADGFIFEFTGRRLRVYGS